MSPYINIFKTYNVQNNHNITDIITISQLLFLFLQFIGTTIIGIRN